MKTGQAAPLLHHQDSAPKRPQVPQLSSHRKKGCFLLHSCGGDSLSSCPKYMPSLPPFYSLHGSSRHFSQALPQHSKVRKKVIFGLFNTIHLALFAEGLIVIPGPWPLHPVVCKVICLQGCSAGQEGGCFPSSPGVNVIKGSEDK